MRLSFAVANLICALLWAGDLIARGFRIQWLLRGLGQQIPFRDAFRLNAWGEAGCALTPMRVAGEPMRLLGMLRSRVPATAAFMAIAIEVLAAWPVIIALAAIGLWRFAPDWLAHARPALEQGVRERLWWVVGVVLVTIAIGFFAARSMRHAGRGPRRSRKRMLVYGRRVSWWPLVAGTPMTAINVLARSAMLPVLALTLPTHPPVGVMLVGSFGLLYSQLVLPTPAGAGVVELGFLAGAAGELTAGDGGSATLLLLAWRFWSVGAGAMLGLLLAIRTLEWSEIRSLLRKAA
jgi:uncharacterized membrane protein YbhN (UPF0104 family)